MPSKTKAGTGTGGGGFPATEESFIVVGNYSRYRWRGSETTGGTRYRLGGVTWKTLDIVRAMNSLVQDFLWPDSTSIGWKRVLIQGKCILMFDKATPHLFF
jgi:hypothetical protein